MGLRVSEGKPKYVEVTRRPVSQKIFKATNYDVECVKEFKHLGTQVMNSNRIIAEIAIG
jgi:hypothetical protein